MSGIPTTQAFLGAEAERWFRINLHKALEQMSPTKKEEP
jgi:hypothetical protein